MHLTSIRMVILATLVIASSAWAAGWQREAASPEDAVLDVLVWGTHVPIDVGAFSGALKSEIEAYLKRAAAFHSGRPAPASGGVLEMVYAAQVSYERRLVAVTADPRAPTLAAAYVSDLKPCYEWEGYHGCPQGEAEFADRYRASHSGGPFDEYLSLLAAHRWLCAAEAFVYEQNPAEAARVRRLYELRVAEARKVRSLLVRSAADRLASKARCF